MHSVEGKKTVLHTVVDVILLHPGRYSATTKFSPIDVVAICDSTHISFSLFFSSFCQRVSLYRDELVDFKRQKASADHRDPTLPPIISLRIPCLANTIRSCSGE